MLSIGVLSMAVVCTQQAITQESAGSEWTRLVELLYTKSISSHLHQSLLVKYKVAPDVAVKPASGENYSVPKTPISIGPEEEWPSLLSGSDFLLDDPLYTRVLEASDSILKTTKFGITSIDRVLIQNDLWAAFDIVFQAGLDLRRQESGKTAIRRRRLLKTLAALIRKIALSTEELRALRPSEELRDFVFLQNGMTESKPTEFHSTEWFHFHDGAHRFRRVNRFYYWDPKRPMEKLSAADISGFNRRTLALSRGSVAMIEEDLIAISPDGSLIPTGVPGLLKVYTVDGPDEENPLRFMLYRLKTGASGLTPDALRALPQETEAWAMIDLPSMPGPGKPPYRSSLAVSCAGCHGTYPNAFCPFLEPMDASYYRFSQGLQEFTSRRNVSIKQYSAEYIALRSYLFHLAEAQSAGAGADSARGEESEAAGSEGTSRLSPSLIIGLLLCVGVLGYSILKRNPKKEGTP